MPVFPVVNQELTADDESVAVNELATFEIAQAHYDSKNYKSAKELFEKVYKTTKKDEARRLVLEKQESERIQKSRAIALIIYLVIP